MTQREIIKYYKDNGGLRCKDWTNAQVKTYIKTELGNEQRVYENTCRELIYEAKINQR